MRVSFARHGGIEQKVRTDVKVEASERLLSQLVGLLLLLGREILGSWSTVDEDTADRVVASFESL